MKNIALTHGQRQTLIDESVATPYVLGVVQALFEGSMEPEDVPLTETTDHSPWLDSIERDLFTEAPPQESAAAALVRRREHGGFRLVRKVSADDVALIAYWFCARVIDVIRSERQQRLLELFGRFEPIVPQHHSTAVQ